MKKPGPIPRSIRHRFEEKIVVMDSGPNCWVFKQTESKDGYGIIWIGGNYKRAHRVSYELYIGKIPGCC